MVTSEEASNRQGRYESLVKAGRTQDAQAYAKVWLPQSSSTPGGSGTPPGPISAGAKGQTYTKEQVEARVKSLEQAGRTADAQKYAETWRPLVSKGSYTGGTPTYIVKSEKEAAQYKTREQLESDVKAGGERGSIARTELEKRGPDMLPSPETEGNLILKTDEAYKQGLISEKQAGTYKGGYVEVTPETMEQAARLKKKYKDPISKGLDPGPGMSLVERLSSKEGTEYRGDVRQSAYEEQKMQEVAENPLTQASFIVEQGLGIGTIYEYGKTVLTGEDWSKKYKDMTLGYSYDIADRKTYGIGPIQFEPIAGVKAGATAGLIATGAGAVGPAGVFGAKAVFAAGYGSQVGYTVKNPTPDNIAGTILSTALIAGSYAGAKIIGKYRAGKATYSTTAQRGKGYYDPKTGRASTTVKAITQATKGKTSIASGSIAKSNVKVTKIGKGLYQSKGGTNIFTRSVQKLKDIMPFQKTKYIKGPLKTSAAQTYALTKKTGPTTYETKGISLIRTKGQGLLAKLRSYGVVSKSKALEISKTITPKQTQTTYATKGVSQVIKKIGDAKKYPVYAEKLTIGGKGRDVGVFDIISPRAQTSGKVPGTFFSGSGGGTKTILKPKPTPVPDITQQTAGLAKAASLQAAKSSMAAAQTPKVTGPSPLQLGIIAAPLAASVAKAVKPKTNLKVSAFQIQPQMSDSEIKSWLGSTTKSASKLKTVQRKKAIQAGSLGLAFAPGLLQREDVGFIPALGTELFQVPRSKTGLRPATVQKPKLDTPGAIPAPEVGFELTPGSPFFAGAPFAGLYQPDIKLYSPKKPKKYYYREIIHPGDMRKLIITPKKRRTKK